MSETTETSETSETSETYEMILSRYFYFWHTKSDPWDLTMTMLMERVRISNFRGQVLMNRRNEMGGIRVERTQYRRWGGQWGWLREWRFHQTLVEERGSPTSTWGGGTLGGVGGERRGWLHLSRKVFDFNHLCACTLRELLSSEANSSSWWPGERFSTWSLEAAVAMGKSLSLFNIWSFLVFFYILLVLEEESHDSKVLANLQNKFR